MAGQSKTFILGALHTDCERPVSNYDIKYSFPKSNSRCSINTGCVSIEQENRTVCKCPPNAGFITFDDDSSYDTYVAIEKEVANTRQAVILAVFIFSKFNFWSLKVHFNQILAVKISENDFDICQIQDLSCPSKKMQF